MRPKEMTDPITFSGKAIEEIKKAIEEQQLGSGFGLRVAMGGGGCSGGAEPILGFDKQKPTDHVYEIDGVTVLVDKKHMMHLYGKRVEYVEAEGTGGFHFVE